MMVRTDPSPVSLAEADYPPAWQARSVIAILFLVTLLSQLDRQIPALLVTPMKAEFGISDTAFSLLQGYAFAFVYTLMGLPFGRLVDSTNRRNLIVAGMLVWSAMTAMSAFANSYTMLFIARMGVGVGEAVLAPAAYSIIADYVPPSRRGRAIAVYFLSLAIGQGASLLIGGLILQHIPPSGAEVPLIGLLEPWRMAFLIAGTPGILLVGLLFLVREPVRRETAGASVQQAPTIGETIAFMRDNRGALWPIFLCPTMIAIIGYGAMNWAVAFFDRSFGIPPQQMGPLLGLIFAVAGLAGTLTSGLLGDWLVARGAPGARLRVLQIAMLVIVPTASAWSIMPMATISMAMLGVMLFAQILALSSTPVMVQEVVPNRMRGQIVAIYMLISGMCGIALAPTLIALITDYVFADDKALGRSLALVGLPTSLFGLAIAFGSQRAYSEVSRRRAAVAS